MAIPHANPGQVIDIRPLGDELLDRSTTTLIKTDKLEVIRLVLAAGKVIPPHRVSGPITVQCLEGHVEFEALGQTQPLEPGQMLFLPGGEEHAVTAKENSSVLVTLQL
ncbi:MAG: cupin domain-containing protein [Planctomycetaceae bacterium]|nr:cupin domain-containing protein [Planctomycetaceae bacterium]